MTKSVTGTQSFLNGFIMEFSRNKEPVWYIMKKVSYKFPYLFCYSRIASLPLQFCRRTLRHRKMLRTHCKRQSHLELIQKSAEAQVRFKWSYWFLWFLKAETENLKDQLVNSTDLRSMDFKNGHGTVRSMRCVYSLVVSFVEYRHVVALWPSVTSGLVWLDLVSRVMLASCVASVTSHSKVKVHGLLAVTLWSGGFFCTALLKSENN